MPRSRFALCFKRGWLFTMLAVAVIGAVQSAVGRAEFGGEFAPADGWVKPQEQPHRAELCLNGSWDFQPVPVPAGFRRDAGQPPVLPLPRQDGWESTPLKVPSPWNVNTWGCGRDVGPGTDRPYWPDSVYYPSYPVSWDNVEMGWLRRSFRVPPNWGQRRVVLHFEAVAGDCQVRVNGKPAGAHFDKYLPFEIDITDLVNRDGANELLVGVRAHSLFDKRSERFPRMRAPYPCGSETERLVGIWQDVYLLGLPGVRVQDVFVKPLLDQGLLELEVAVRNDTAGEQRVVVGGEIHPWINLAGASLVASPEPRWRLDAAVLAVNSTNVTLSPGQEKKLLIRQTVDNQLQRWAPGSPHLYGAIVRLTNDEGTVLDSHFTRFGWRQWTLRGSDLLLNGERIQLYGDLLHPFGPFTMSRRHVWAWYRMIQDFGGNAVRPHAQIHPREYLELADEMGIVVLDETALFGSSIALNFEEPVAWQRFAEHCKGLVLRDRNHPSVVGWSFGNELFAIFNLNAVPAEVGDVWYRQLTALGEGMRQLDPTRLWISCDGDEDLRGTLPVWTKHFGHGTPLDRLPAINKPLVVGESGGTYYARPKQLAEFNGAEAFASYEGRNHALAIDVYDNIVRMARPRLTYYSASETAWFGLEHLNFGYEDFTRLPGRKDGVFFTAPFREGKPGMQPERLPPYVSTLNPGWDSSLPLYRPLPMFHAQKAALTPAGPQPGPWDRRKNQGRIRREPPAVIYETVDLIGDRSSALARRLGALGITFEGPSERASSAGITIVDFAQLTRQTLADAKRVIDSIHARGGTVLLMLAGQGVSVGTVNDLLPAAIRFTDREATALVPDESHPWTTSLTLPDVYFAEDGGDRFIMRHGMEGPLVDRSRVLLRASNTDWSLFNNAPEKAKCAAVVLYEHLQKPSGAALVEFEHGKGKLLLCTLDYRVASRSSHRFWQALFAEMGIRMRETDAITPAFDQNGALLNALSAGRFPEATLDAALRRDFVGESAVQPTNGVVSSGVPWRSVTSPSRDRFIFREMEMAGASQPAFAVYFSYWLRSPRALDDLLAGGPDVPRLTLFFYVSEACRLFLNGRELRPTRSESVDYRTLLVFENVPLRKDWNHFLVKVASTRLDGDRPGTLAVRMTSSDEGFINLLDSAMELPARQ